jgi:hypothetical protein
MEEVAARATTATLVVGLAATKEGFKVMVQGSCITIMAVVTTRRRLDQVLEEAGI